MYILGGLASSRLDNLLVRKEQLAIAVTAYLMPFQHASMVQRYLYVTPGLDVAPSEPRYDAFLPSFINHGPSQADLARPVSILASAPLRQLEPLGGICRPGAARAERLLFSNN